MSFIASAIAIRTAALPPGGGGGWDNTLSTEFDGVSAYSVDSGATNTTMGITTNMSCSFWVKANGTVGAFDTIIGNSSTYPSPPDGFGFYWVSNTMRFYITSFNAHLSAAPCTINDGNWYHVVGTFDGQAGASPQQIRCYVNGVGGTWDNHTNSVLGNVPLYVGKGGNFTGYIAPTILNNVAVWNVTLTPTEVTEIYNGGTPTNLAEFSGTPPQAWYRMGDGALFPNIPNVGNITSPGLNMVNMAPTDFVSDVP